MTSEDIARMNIKTAATPGGGSLSLEPPRGAELRLGTRRSWSAFDEGAATSLAAFLTRTLSRSKSTCFSRKANASPIRRPQGGPEG